MLNLLDLIEVVANCAGVIGAIISLMIYVRLKRNPLVLIKLVHGDSVIKEFTIPKTVFSRSELLGRLGMFSKAQRFTVASMSNVQTLKEIDDATLGKDLEVIIQLTEEEITQFL